MPSDRTDWARQTAEKCLKDWGIETLAVDPIAIAEKYSITVQAKPPTSLGVSGMLIRSGNLFAIAYATHIDNEGFQRFSVAHELGHYFLPGHPEHVFRAGDVHESRAGFVSGDSYEQEADFFAVGLLMPKGPFSRALSRAGDGLAAVESLAKTCRTSLTSTAIRYAHLTDAPVAVVVSSGGHVEYAFMSEAFKTFRGLEWLRKGSFVPSHTATHVFNADNAKVLSGARISDSTDVATWFGGGPEVELAEEVVGLGNYGKVLTVLSASVDDVPDEDEDDGEDE